MKTKCSLNYMNYKHNASFLSLEHSHYLWVQRSMEVSWRVKASSARDMSKN